MLRHIHVRNFAIIDTVQLELEGGLTVMTGETGAGKSILVDALGLLLGDRAGAEAIRPGSDRAELEALFTLESQPQAQEKLQELALDDESGDCLLRRVIVREGASRAFVNGRTVNLATLRELGGLLVDIHGQHEHQHLLRPAVQRDLLDTYSAHDTRLNVVRLAYGAWKTTHEQLETLRQSDTQRSERIDLLQHQLSELEALRLEADEWPQLESEHRRLAQAGKLITLTHGALQILDEGSDDQRSLHTQINQITHQLSLALSDDPSLQPSLDLLQQGEILISEAIDSLRGYVDALELDPERLHQLESRLSALHDAARKYRVRPEDLHSHQHALQEQLDTLEHSGASLEQLSAELAQHVASYQYAASALSASRQQAAARLTAAVTAAIRGLGMPHAQFELRVQHDPHAAFTAHGLDAIEALVTTNPGQPLQALNKVASGGELSRISLALRVQTAAQGEVGTLIFDEVDTGIGGSVAEVVGRLLADLGRERQVLCVTHLPQVAAQGQHHLNVHKQQDATSTRTIIHALTPAARIDELARMIGGVNITPQTRKLAQEMLASAANSQGSAQQTPSQQTIFDTP
ncbi:MAG: DNA repair protein RecN [Gammaproteobacteria bacterium 28-57-27]|nr:MAG: DNA repair protein RecN [Gammaproteobacteria bacterium 28-57-27]